MEPKHLTSYPALTAALGSVDLRGKSVLVTGGGYGIGADIARSFAARNASHIILVGRTESKLKATASSLQSENTRVSFRIADISSKADVQRLFDSLDVSPDFLINNAGLLPTPSLFVDDDLDEWWRGFSVNVFGTALVTQTYLRHRRAQHDAASLSSALIVTINTIGAYSIRQPRLSAYGASKAALSRWNELVTSDVPAKEARFVSVHPGTVQTDMVVKSELGDIFPNTEGKLVGEFVTWLTKEDASFLNGRFVWVNWDIEELLLKKSDVLDKDLLISSLSQ
ncbi:hypothetical protein G7Z17_g1462 [Cylindrodendrum hubeiense]|uniref:NAD(P)-binding protein n=1 Tax=Cylindrodendrum hubeiense TaxID=595255 RepID=A0A9P5HG39_9HYPO|nr:hypothetical protein G7Z17_g1462 [Cylindrodendrum hubeiense]